jgi:hypothetical protein
MQQQQQQQVVQQVTTTLFFVCACHHTSSLMPAQPASIDGLHLVCPAQPAADSRV